MNKYGDEQIIDRMNCYFYKKAERNQNSHNEIELRYRNKLHTVATNQRDYLECCILSFQPLHFCFN